MKKLVLAGALVAGSVAHAGRGINAIYYNGVKFDGTTDAPEHFTGEKSYRDVDTGQVQSREQYVDGELEGPFSHYDFDGKLDETGANRRGKRHGVFKRYRNGKLQMEMSYVDGKLSGVQKSYRDGVLERVYLMDPKVAGVGTDMQLNPKGQLTSLTCGPRPIGKQDLAWCGMNGVQSTVSLYDTDGTLRESRQYLWGKLHGTDKKLNVRTGAVMEEDKYDKGELVGGQNRDAHGNTLYKSDCDAQRAGCTETEMFPGGKETKTVTVWKSGKIAEQTERWQNGKVREHMAGDGVRYKIERFDDEGAPESKGTYVVASDWYWQPYVGDGVVEYYLHGVLWRREKLVAGSREGLTQEWWKQESHAIREDSEYVKDSVARQKVFVDDKLVVELEYMPDGSLKSRKLVAPLPKGIEI